MNTLLLAAYALPHGIMGLLIGFLIIIVAIAILSALIWAVETYIIGSPMPTPVRMIIGLVIIVLIVIWIIGAIGAGG